MKVLLKNLPVDDSCELFSGTGSNPDIYFLPAEAGLLVTRLQDDEVHLLLEHSYSTTNSPKISVSSTKDGSHTILPFLYARGGRLFFVAIFYTTKGSAIVQIRTGAFA